MYYILKTDFQESHHVYWEQQFSLDSLGKIFFKAPIISFETVDGENVFKLQLEIAVLTICDKINCS